MLFREITAVYGYNRAEYINSICRQNAEISMLKQMVHTVTGVFQSVN
jgi:hypothetical protein